MRIHTLLHSRRPIELDFNIISGGFDDFDWSNPLVCHGKGGGGSGGGTTTSTSQPPQQVLDAYQTAINAAQSAASQPLQQYGGPTVAGFTPDQTSAFNTINNAQGSAQPFIQGAQNLIQQGTQPLWSGVQQFSPSGVQQYMSPYTSQVYNAQVAQEQNTDAQQQQALKGNAISSGAWGGDRAGVASAVLSGQQDLANNTANANILNQGYNTGLQEFNTQQQSQLGANEANSYLNQQGAFGLANLGNETLGTQLTGAAAQAQSGAAQQQLGQELLNVPYQQFLQQQAYPFQTAQFFGNVAEGIGSNSGGTSTTTQPAPNSSKGKNRGGRIPYQRGGPVRLASGGGAAFGVPDQSISYIPATTSQRGGGGGPPRPPTIPGQPQQKGLSMADLMTIGKGLQSMLGKSGSSGSFIGAGGGSSAADPSFSSALDMGGESNPLDAYSSGAFDSAGSDAAASAASDSAGSGFGDFFSNLFDFAQGGRAPGGFGTGGPVRQNYDSGGKIKHDNTWLSTIGDWAGSIVGSIFGGPAGGYVGGKAGADAGGTLGDLFGGNWDAVGSDIKAGPIGADPIFANVVGDNSPGQGNSPQLGGNFSNTSKFGINNNPGNGQNTNFFKNRGGRIGFDDGGTVGGTTPTAAMEPTQSNNTQMQYSSYNNMTPDQLQNLVMRLPAGTMQQKAATAVLQQKRTMPNVGQAAQGGFGTQTAQQQPGMARGGFAMGGYPTPPSADQLDRELELQNEMNAESPASNAGIYIPGPPPAMSSLATSSPAAGPTVGPIPQISANDLQPPAQTGRGNGPPPAPAAPAAPPPAPDAKEGVQALQQIASLGDKGDNADDSDSASSDSSGSDSPPPRTERRDPNPWLSLATGAFAAAAGTSPYRMQNQAAGVLAGLKNYGDQVKESDSVNTAADKLLAEAQQHRDAISREQDRDDETNRHNVADEGLKQKQIDALAQKTTNGLLDDNNLNFMADQYLAGDKSVVSGLGYGNAGAQNRAALRSRIAARAVDANMSPAQVAEQLADYQGTIAEKRTVGTRTGAIKVGAEAVNGAAQMALDSSNKVDRTQYPDLNKIDLNLAARNGDTNVVDFMVKNGTLANEYAAAQNPRGVPRIEDKSRALEMLSTAYNKGQYAAAVHAIQQEIGNIKHATATVRGQSDTGYVAPSDTPAAATAPTPQLTPAQIQQIQQYRAQKQQGGGP